MEAPLQVELKPEQPFDLHSFKLIRRYCEQKLKATQQQVQRARTTAARQIRATRRQARALGYRQGLHKAQKENAHALIDAEQAYHSAVNKAQFDCLQIATKIAKQVISEEITIAKDSLTARIEGALKELHTERSLQIIVHPDYSSVVKEGLYPSAEGSALTITSSSDIQPGNAVVVTDSGTTEIDWQQHFNLICSGLKQALFKRIQ